MIETKTCSKCNVSKMGNEFYFRKDRNKYRNECKECNHKHYKDYWKIYKNKVEVINHRKDYQREYYSIPENKEYRKNYMKEYDSIPENKENKKIKSKRYSYIDKKIVVSHYSDGNNNCKCCGEKDIRFLTIDHINNDGANHRRKIKTFKLYRWLINNNFPNGYRILCYNCNCGRKCGVCPHIHPKTYKRTYYYKNRKKVIGHYSNNTNECKCCKEQNFDFLTLHHSNNNGSEHRKNKSVASDIYRWLIVNNYPCGYEVLCYNCNCGKEKNGGVCPHKSNHQKT